MVSIGEIPPEVSLIALSLENIAIRGKIKDLVKEVIEAREGVLASSTRVGGHGRHPSGGAGGESTDSPSRPVVGGGVDVLMKAYKNIRTFEVQLVCEMAELGARIVPVVTPAMLTRKLDIAPSESFGNTAQ